MGTGEQSTPSKPSKPSSSSQEVPMTPYADWSNSMQAYYGVRGTPPPFFTPSGASPSPHPYVWAGQHPPIPPYGTPVPYPAMYPPGGVYTHPSMTMIPSSAPTNTEFAVKSPNVKDQASAKKPKVGKVASSTGNHAASESAETGGDGSSDETQNADANAPKHVVPATNVNTGMSLWNPLDPNAGGASKASANPSGATSAIPIPMVGCEGALAEQWKDERELKRQKRKQSNRESARRSRLRKQAECDELQTRVESLTQENRGLREELQRLSEECKKLASENNSIKDELTSLCGPEAVANLEQTTMDSAAVPHGND